MAGLASILKSGVKVIDKVTKTLQCSVTLNTTAANPADYLGDQADTNSTTLMALLEYKQKQVKGAGNQIIFSSATVTVTDVPGLATATSGLGLQAGDRIILPDGQSMDVLAVGGFLNPGTSQPFATEAYL